MQAQLVSGEVTTIDYANGGSAIAAGGVVVDGTVAGVAIHGIPASDDGCIEIAGIYDVQKITEVGFAVGATVYWNATATPQGSISGTGAATATVEDYVLGICVLATTTDDDERVRVKLQQYAIPTS